MALVLRSTPSTEVGSKAAAAPSATKSPPRTQKKASGTLLCALAPVVRFEDPQVSRYLSGEHYEAHYDAPDRSEPDGRGFMRCGGTRMATVLVYLNTVAHGGETKFTRLRTPASRLVRTVEYCNRNSNERKTRPTQTN